MLVKRRLSTLLVYTLTLIDVMEIDLIQRTTMTLLTKTYLNAQAKDMYLIVSGISGVVRLTSEEAEDIHSQVVIEGCGALMSRLVQTR